MKILLKHHENLSDAFTKALDDNDWQGIKNLLLNIHPADIADVLEAIPRELRPQLWNQVNTAAKGEVLLKLHDEVRQQIVELTPEHELLAALQTLQMDELADLDADLPISIIDAMVNAMDSQRRERYDAVRSYPDDTAGGLMDSDTAVVRADVTLNAVLRYLRKAKKQDGNMPEHLDSLIVVDRKNTYLGVLKLSDLVSFSPETSVINAMRGDVTGIPVLLSADEVARIFEDQDLISAPVIDDNNRLLGRITIDDVVDVMRDEAERALMNRVGLSGESDMFAPVLLNASRRAVWLGINLLTTFIAAWVIGLFEGSIEQIVALAVLMPVVASMGGIAGTQTLTLVTRGIALQQIGQRNAWRLLHKELAQAILNGLFWAIVVAIIAILWFDSVNLGIVFGIALTTNIITGVFAGIVVPLTLQRIGIDPALAGGVILTTATDVVGFLCFLGLATLVLL